MKIYSPDEHLFTVNERELVVVKTLGNPGFLMYVQFWLIVLPVVETKNKQQTPNLETCKIIYKYGKKDNIS